MRNAHNMGMNDSSQKKKLKLQNKNSDIRGKMPLKLDFNTKSMSNVTILTTKPSKKKISVQSKLSNNIPKAPQSKRNQLSGTFCQATYQERPKLSSRNNVITYSNIYNSYDEVKNVAVNQENSEVASNASKKFSYNWVMKPTSSQAADKTTKNYRSMTSLMSRPSAARNLSLHKERNTLGPELTKRDQTSGMRKNIFQQIQNLTRRDSNSKLKN